MKCDRTNQTFCVQMETVLEKSKHVKLADPVNLADQSTGLPRVWMQVTPKANEYYFFNFCPFCGGDWSFQKDSF